MASLEFTVRVDITQDTSHEHRHCSSGSCGEFLHYICKNLGLPSANTILDSSSPVLSRFGRLRLLATNPKDSKLRSVTLGWIVHLINQRQSVAIYFKRGMQRNIVYSMSMSDCGEGDVTAWWCGVLVRTISRCCGREPQPSLRVS